MALRVIGLLSVCTAIIASEVATRSAFTNDLEGAGVAEPIQIIGRASDGSLEVVEEGLQTLAEMLGEFQVLGVVGNFHTGKSFLMNQLMGRMSGFETGPTVNPTTEGIWFWGQPVFDPDTGMKVLLLDSEGLSAPGNSADYDAKVFAVVTLLSSHLMYNSVKIIDETSMDYLQVLARRAQLFALKTSLNSADMNVEAMIQFPALTWVVQDFFQLQVNEESPTDWLHRLMRQQAEGKDETFEGLDKVFPESYCKTLFLPATGRTTLQNLDSMDMDKLTEEYQEDRSELVSHLIGSLRKHLQASVAEITGGETGVKPAPRVSARTGKAIAGMVRVLVNAANGGQMSKIPSMWDLFMKDQIQEARHQSERVFTQFLATSKGEDPPVVQSEMQQRIEVAVKKASNVFKQATFGLHSVIGAEALKGLRADLKTQGNQEIVFHRQRIDSYVKRFVDRSVEKAEKQVKAIKLPMSSHELKTRLDRELGKIKAGLADAFKKYGSTDKAFTASLEGLANKKTIENTQKHTKLLEKAQKNALALYDKQMESSVTEKEPQTDDTMLILHKAALENSREAWKKLTTASADEPQFKQYHGNFNNMVRTAQKVWKTKNQEHVYKLCHDIAKKEIKNVKNSFREAYSSLPLDEATLKDLTEQKSRAGYQNFESIAKKYSANEGYTQARAQLAKGIKDLAIKFEKKNIETQKELVEEPLKRAKKVAERMVGSYWFEYTFLRECRTVAEEEIGTAIKSEIRAKVIDSWLEDELQAVRPNYIYFYTILALGGGIVMAFFMFKPAATGK